MESFEAPKKPSYNNGRFSRSPDIMHRHYDELLKEQAEFSAKYDEGEVDITETDRLLSTPRESWYKGVGDLIARSGMARIFEHLERSGKIEGKEAEIEEVEADKDIKRSRKDKLPKAKNFFKRSISETMTEPNILLDKLQSNFNNDGQLYIFLNNFRTIFTKCNKIQNSDCSQEVKAEFSEKKDRLLNLIKDFDNNEITITTLKTRTHNLYEQIRRLSKTQAKLLQGE